MSARDTKLTLSSETLIEIAGSPVHSSTCYPMDGTLTVFFGPVRVFHYNVEDWRASAQASRYQTDRGPPLNEAGDIHRLT
jgi:hypothetical protein